ncbi:MAG: hypothetical protein ACLSVD_17310 [Eggerthellaceae bacterium]
MQGERGGVVEGGLRSALRSRPWVTVACVVVWVIGAALLIMSLAQMQTYASIINNSGVVRGGTQMAVKLELAGVRADDVASRVDSLLARLIADEERGRSKRPRRGARRLARRGGRMAGHRGRDRARVRASAPGVCCSGEPGHWGSPTKP